MAIGALPRRLGGSHKVAGPLCNGSVGPARPGAVARRRGAARRPTASALGATDLQQASTSSLLQTPPKEQAAHEQAGEAFSWTKHWYAVAVADDVEKDRPYAFTLLGQPLVIWHDGSEWRCAEDRCPHRAAPLSEGKVWSDGSLMCSYHGWRFRGEDGGCVAIPQASSAEAEASACANRRSCATMRPIRECMSLLFVWGESGPIAAAEAAAAQPPLLGEWEGQQVAGMRIDALFKSYHRDIPYDYQTLIENVVDPAHVPFSHHGVQGNRDTVKHGMFDMRRLESESQPFLSSFAVFFDQVEFLPPSTIAYKRTKPDGAFMCFISFATPTTPGRCRVLAQTVSTYAKDPLPLAILSLFPRWYEHVMIRHKVLDGDSVFLHLQEHKLVDEARQLEAEASAGSGNGAGGSDAPATAVAARAWHRLYFMPAAADVLVAAFKSWLDSKGGGGPLARCTAWAQTPTRRAWPTAACCSTAGRRTPWRAPHAAGPLISLASCARQPPRQPRWRSAPRCTGC